MNWAKMLITALVILALALSAKPIYMLSKAYLAQALLTHAWHKSQSEEAKILPWRWADTYPVAKLTYQSANKSYQQSWIVLAGLSGRTMAFAPAWLEDSAMPNTFGNTVISAHNDSHFNILEHAQIGDSLLLESRDKTTKTYQVIDINIVSKNDNSAYLFENNTMITLITCYPFNSNIRDKQQRLVVQAVAI